MLNTDFSPSPLTALVVRRTAQILLLPACLAAAALLALIGQYFQSMEQVSKQAIDNSRQVLFLAQNDGSVRALHMRNTIGELGVMRNPARHKVRDIALDPSGQHLWVLGDDATYHYDALSLKLIERQPLEHQDSLAFARVDEGNAQLAPSAGQSAVQSRRDLL